MSVTLCLVVFVTVYLSVITGYALIVDNAPLDRILDVIVGTASILRYGYMSELIKEVNNMVQQRWSKIHGAV